MKTYFLGNEEVRAYLREFVQRLKRLEPMPTVWCAVTQSGDDLLQALVRLVADEFPTLLGQVFAVGIEVREEAVTFVGVQPDEVLSGRSVLLLDGSIHSGRMMSRCVAEVQRHGVAALTSYALVMKRCSQFIPTFWGVMIEECDRAYFLLDAIPNNRLDAGHRYPQPLAHLQKLSKSALSRPTILSGVPSIDRMTWADRFYQMQTAGAGMCTYLLERAEEIVGFLTVHYPEPDVLSVDEVVVASAQRGHGYGGVLLRFAETLARHSSCRSLRLNAIEERQPVYEGYGYKPVPGREVLSIDVEKYLPMEKRVLYHQDPLR